MIGEKEQESIEERIEEEQEEIKQLVEETVELAEENKELVEKTKALTEENNRLLRSIQRWGMIQVGLRVVWYLILIGLPFAVYYYVVNPYLEFFGAPSGATERNFEELPIIKSIGNILGQ